MMILNQMRIDSFRPGMMLFRKKCWWSSFKRTPEQRNQWKKLPEVFLTICNSSQELLNWFFTLFFFLVKKILLDNSWYSILFLLVFINLLERGLSTYCGFDSNQIEGVIDQLFGHYFWLWFDHYLHHKLKHIGNFAWLLNLFVLYFFVLYKILSCSGWCTVDSWSHLCLKLVADH